MGRPVDQGVDRYRRVRDYWILDVEGARDWFHVEQLGRRELQYCVDQAWSIRSMR